MSKAPLALVLLGTIAMPPLAAASSATAKSASMGVSVTVVASCGVRVDPSGTVDVRCASGGADRVMVAASEPKVVMLERDATRTSSAQLQPEKGEGGSTGERFVTLQF